MQDSGKVASSDTTGIVYAGQVLDAGRLYDWKVRMWDRDGQASYWSRLANWSMGLLDANDWHAQWINHRNESPLHTDHSKLHLPAARFFRKPFRLAKPVRRATLYTTALGFGDLHLNGRRMSDHFFGPDWSDYHERVYYQTHDVT